MKKLRNSLTLCAMGKLDEESIIAGPLSYTVEKWSEELMEKLFKKIEEENPDRHCIDAISIERPAKLDILHGLATVAVPMDEIKSITFYLVKAYKTETKEDGFDVENSEPVALLVMSNSHDESVHVMEEIPSSYIPFVMAAHELSNFTMDKDAEVV